MPVAGVANVGQQIKLKAKVTPDGAKVTEYLWTVAGDDGTIEGGSVGRALGELIVGKGGKDIPVEQFTAAGDGFRIDFGYRPNGVTNYLHAISLERDLNQSKLLSYTFWRIRQTTEARMTAIVADGDPSLPMVQSCRQILAGGEIAIQPLAGIDSFLDGVGRELRPL
ncbi:MAG: hypothetical protein IH935_10515 [Acidobacteria bacterium]|nr:hypothetical protein [Acidobacteriota bacterium]